MSSPNRVLHHLNKQPQCKYETWCNLTLFVFFFVFLFALFTGGLALRWLGGSCLSRTSGASSWEWWWRRGGAGQHLTATQGTGEELQQHGGNALIYKETDLEQEVQHGWTERQRVNVRHSAGLVSLEKLCRKKKQKNLQSSFMQNFCQLIVLCVAISAQAFRCSIWTERNK